MKPLYPTKQLHLLFLFYICLLSIKFLNSQNLEAQCDGTSIKYSVLINLSQYLDNENNIDNRTIYTPINISSAKCGALKDTYFNKSLYPSLNDQYEIFDDLLSDLHNHKIEAIITDMARANETQMFSNEFSMFGIPKFYNSGFGIKKGSALHSELDDITQQDYYDAENGIRKWFGISFLNGYYIDKELNGDKELNAAMQLKHPIFSFKDKVNNNEPVGIDVEILYCFAKANGYKINMKEVNTYDEQVEMLKNGSADIAGGYFLQRTESKYTDNVDFIYLHPVLTTHLIRYENSPDSKEWSSFYESWKDLDGEVLGVIPSSSFVDLTKQNFPNHIPFECTDVFNAFERLLLENTEGFLIDEPIAEYMKIQFPERITYFDHDFYKNEYGLGFPKSNEALLNKFNEFLSKTDMKELYNKWMNNPSGMNIDKNLETEGTETLRVKFYLNQKPLTYRNGADIRGYEIDLVFKFAKEYGYNVELTECTISERITSIENN